MNSTETAVMELIKRDLDLSLESSMEYSDFYRLLCETINQMILFDFERLIRLLYRIDIDEKKLRKILSGQPDVEAGKIIAELIIEREAQKIKTRSSDEKSTPPISDEEKW